MPPGDFSAYLSCAQASEPPRMASVADAMAIASLLRFMPDLLLDQITITAGGPDAVDYTLV
jgi:hypothetical protein